MTDNTQLIDAVRKVRQRVAERRAERLQARYPECTVIDVDPLSDDYVVREALMRELAHQSRVLNDLQKGATDGEG